MTLHGCHSNQSKIKQSTPWWRRVFSKCVNGRLEWHVGCRLRYIFRTMFNLYIKKYYFDYKCTDSRCHKKTAIYHKKTVFDVFLNFWFILMCQALLKASILAREPQWAASVVFLMDRFLYWTDESSRLLKITKLLHRHYPGTPIAPQLVIRQARVYLNDGEWGHHFATSDYISHRLVICCLLTILESSSLSCCVSMLCIGILVVCFYFIYHTIKIKLLNLLV